MSNLEQTTKAYRNYESRIEIMTNFYQRALSNGMHKEADTLSQNIYEIRFKQYKSLCRELEKLSRKIIKEKDKNKTKELFHRYKDLQITTSELVSKIDQEFYLDLGII